jgi:FMN-dependent NADH-azoreductase
MTIVLYTEASPSKSSSNSIAIAREFLAAYHQYDSAAVIDKIDVWEIELPEFDANMIAAKFAVLRTQKATPEQRAVWSQAVSVSRRFNEADIYLFSLPMWNFGIPYRLKHLIDIVTLPGQNWSWSKEHGYKPLLRNKRAVLIYSSANDYRHKDGDSLPYIDFQKAYMRQWLRFIGIETVQEIVIAPTLTDPVQLCMIKQQAKQQARAIAIRLQAQDIEAAV